ncbi:MAG: DsbA family protein [Pseudomonadota bacterium]
MKFDAMSRRAFLSSTAAVALTAAGASLLPASGAFAQDAPVVQEMIIGDENAPVTIIEYASFTCPHCATFHEAVYPQIRENYVDTGKVKFVFREVYFDRYGLWAGMLARCDGGSRYFGIVDRLFKQQAEWSRAGEPADVVAAMRKIGATAGLTKEQMDSCLQNGAMAKALVEEYQKNAEADNVRGTPQFVINGRGYSNMPYSQFEEAIDQALGS